MNCLWAIEKEKDKVEDFKKELNTILNGGTDDQDYLNQKSLNKAKKYYKKGLEIASKYEVKEVQAIFLQNLSNTSIMDYEYDKALDYILESRQVSTELQDSNGLFVCYVNLGKIYLFTGKIDKAYEKYLYVKEIFKSGSITNIESVTDYHDFLVHFYLF